MAAIAPVVAPDVTVTTGDYGYLSLLITPPPLAGPAASAPAPSTTVPIVPNQSHPFTDATFLVIKEWYLFFVALVAYLASLLSPGGNAGGIQVLAPSIDEADAEWYATGSVDGVSDPVTFTATFVGQSRFGIQIDVETAGMSYATVPTVTITGADGGGWCSGQVATVIGGAVTAISAPTEWYGLVEPLIVTIAGGGGTQATATAHLGRQFAAGDFIQANDPGNYEVLQLTSIIPLSATTAKFTAPRAQYGSAIAAHSGVAFYRLQNELFVRPYNPAIGPQMLRLPWSNMCVAAVTVTPPGSPPNTINLNIPATTLEAEPACPGLRTRNGACYTEMVIPGGLAVGQITNKISIRAMESVDSVFIKVDVAPVGAVGWNGDADAAIGVYVFMVDQNGDVWLVDSVAIDTTKLESFAWTNAPAARSMPYHLYFPVNAPNVDWPPNRFPKVTSGLTRPVAVDASVTAPMAQDYLLVGLVDQVGATSATGTVTTAGEQVTSVSGTDFTGFSVGMPITINGVVYTIGSSPAAPTTTVLYLTSSAGAQTGVDYSYQFTGGFLTLTVTT